MREISLNIMDIVQNSIVSGANVITIDINENTAKDIFTVSVEDNGKGMSEEECKKATDPFYTTRKTRKIGLGLSIFKMAAEHTGGKLCISSKKNVGTKVKAQFVISSINMIPLGDINSTINMLIKCNPNLDFVYIRTYNNKSFVMDTREIKKILEDESLISCKEVTHWINDFLKEQTQIILGGIGDYENTGGTKGNKG